MKTKLPLWTTLALLCGLGIGWSLRSPGAGSETNSGPARASAQKEKGSDDGLKAQLEAERAKVRQLRDALREANEEGPAISAELSEKPERPHLSEEDEVAYEKQQVAARVAAIVTALDAEPVDRAWSEAMSESIASSLARVGRELPQTSLREVDCRSTLCKASFVHGNVNEYMDFIEHYEVQDFERAFFHRVNWFEKDTADQLETAVYFAAKADGLPSPERTGSG